MCKSLTFVFGPVIVPLGCGEKDGDICVLHIDVSEKEKQRDEPARQKVNSAPPS